MIHQEKLVHAMLSHAMFYPGPHNNRSMAAGFSHPSQPAVHFDGLVTLPPPPPMSRHISSGMGTPFPPHYVGPNTGVVHASLPTTLPPTTTISMFGPLFTSGSSPNSSSSAFPVMHLTPPPSRGGMPSTTASSSTADDFVGRHPVMTSSSSGEPFAMNVMSMSTSK